MSIGIYWWPNPDTPDGLPYVRHDGKVNPESRDGTFVANRNNRMIDAIYCLVAERKGLTSFAESVQSSVRKFFAFPER